MRLSPVDPSTYMMQSATAHAHFFAGRHREASSWARMALREQPDYHSAFTLLNPRWKVLPSNRTLMVDVIATAASGREKMAQALQRFAGLQPGILPKAVE
jgi:hypothetical protein